jgi:hypothetical protein
LDSVVKDIGQIEIASGIDKDARRAFQLVGSVAVAVASCHGIADNALINLPYGAVQGGAVVPVDFNNRITDDDRQGVSQAISGCF